MLVSVCKYHPQVPSLSHTWHIAYGENRQKKWQKKRTKKTETNACVIWCLLWSLADVAARLSATEDALHLALRVEGIFLLQNVRRTAGGEGTGCVGTASFSQNVSKKGEKSIKSIFVKNKKKCKYPHPQKLECWSYLLSRHGILLYVIYMQSIILWLSLFCICVC